MELREFIRETLVSICLGVEEAQKRAPSSAVINPTLNQHGDVLVDFDPACPLNCIEFDVCVTTSRAADASAEATAKIMVFSADLTGAASTGLQETSRIKFKINAVLPVSKG